MCNGLISKILLFSINFILLLGGIAVLTIGALGLSDPTVVENLYSYVFKATDFKLADLVNLSDLVIAPCIVMICIGSVVIVLALFGLLSAMGSRCILVVYGIIMLTLILVELAGIVYVSVPVAYTNFQQNVNNVLYPSLRDNFEPVSFDSSGSIIPPNTTAAKTWIAIQFNYSCCGVHGYQDYSEFTWSNNITNGAAVIRNAAVPPSCCQRIDQWTSATNVDQFNNLDECLTNSRTPYKNIQGCSDYLLYSLTEATKASVIACASLVALQVLCLGFSIHLFHAASSSSQTGMLL